jgi:hypothetical protein
VRTSLGLPRNSMPWTQLGAKLRGVAGLRKIDLVNVAWAARVNETRGQGKSTTDIKADFWVDVSKSVLRRPWSAKLRSFKDRCQLYSFEYDRCLSGSDQMRAHGWPLAMLVGAPQCDLVMVSADGSSLPLATLVQTVMWANPFGPWRMATDALQ